MDARTVEDRLRQEYFDLATDIRRVAEHLEAELRYRLLPLTRELSSSEKIVVTARAKECDSAIDKLRRQQEGSIFYSENSANYTLTTLDDLAAVRVLVFPRRRMEEINRVLRGVFPKWESRPFREGPELGYKYVGSCDASNQVRGEYQIIPMLVGLFWEVEHSALYKPAERIKALVRVPSMQQRQRNVLEALTAFEDEWSRLLKDVGPESE